MGGIRYTEQEQSWLARIGGGYADKDTLELVAEHLDMNVVVGPAHPLFGLFMVPDHGQANDTTKETT